MFYGCVFCRTTREKAVARAMEERCPGLTATAASQIKHKSEQGRKYTVEHILLPGYVFFMAEAELLPNLFPIQDALRLLTNPGGSWQLADTDARFARFVLDHNGVIGLSRARYVGDKVKITDGPLKAMEGHIIKIDRRSRNGLVEFRFDERVWKVWLAFEMVE